MGKTGVTLGMLVGLALAASSLVPVPASVEAEGGTAAPPGQTTAGPRPRPDLALGLRDLPPGYEEVPSLELKLDDVPLQDRVMRQIRPGAGPGWVWTMTYQGQTPVTQDRVDFLADDLSAFFRGALSDVAQITDWTERDPAGLGTLAKLYTFQFRVPGSDGVGDGALAVFGPGDYLTYLAVLNVDGQAVSDLRMLARIVNSRVDAQRTAGVAPR
jgi:hypothetical protein